MGLHGRTGSGALPDYSGRLATKTLGMTDPRFTPRKTGGTFVARYVSGR